MVKKKAYIICFNYVNNSIQNKLNINCYNTNQIITYYTLTNLIGFTTKTALYICLFL